MSITETPEPVTIRPQRSIGEFSTGMVVMDENGRDDLEITQHPVQEGAKISDHAYLKPTDLSIKAVFGDDEMPLQEVYDRLRAIQAEREPFDVVTGKRIYKNMLFKSIAVTTDHSSENILSCSFTLQEVIIVQVEVTTVAPRAQQKNPAKTGATQNAGAKSAKADDSANAASKRKSVLKSASGGIKSFFN